MSPSEPKPEVLRRALMLRQSPIFEGLTTGTVLGLAEHARERELRAGQRFESRTSAGMIHVAPPNTLAPRDERGSSLRCDATVPELAPWLARRSVECELVAATDVAVLDIEVRYLELAIEDDFDLFRALARATARDVLASPDLRTLQRGREAVVPDTFELVDRLVLLRSTLPFARVHVQALLQLARHALAMRIEDGVELWRIGDAADQALFPVRGGVRALIDGREAFSVGAGHLLGGLDVLAGEPRWFTAVAEHDLVAITVQTENLLDVLEDNSELARDVLAMLAAVLVPQ